MFTWNFCDAVVQYMVSTDPISEADMSDALIRKRRVKVEGKRQNH